MCSTPTNFIYLPLKTLSLYNICVSSMGDERSSGNPANGSLACTIMIWPFPTNLIM